MKSLWKTWRAIGARVPPTGTQWVELRTVDGAQDPCVADYHGRATCAPSFPQATVSANHLRRTNFGTVIQSARQQSPSPYYCYWLFKMKDNK